LDKYTFRSGPLDVLKFSSARIYLPLLIKILACPETAPDGPFIKLP
jgi:hypothetical protein